MIALGGFKVFKNFISMFSKKKEELIEEEVVEKTPKPLPDIIEIPWTEVAGIKNFEDTILRIHDDLKEFYYKSRMNELKTLKAIEKLEKLSDEKEKNLRDKYLKEATADYDFDIPSTTGKPGFFKKQKPDK